MPSWYARQDFHHASPPESAEFFSAQACAFCWQIEIELLAHLKVTTIKGGD